MTPAPIALFVYNRPVHTRRAIETLQRDELSGESDLFIFSDGPKGPGTIDAVREVRNFLRGIAGFKSITIVERERNLGLAASVIDGVTRLCDEFGRVIVLEDDLIVSPHFLEYMNTALDRYGNDERVMQVSGHMFPVEIPAKTDAVFLPIVTSWGWATWKRAWLHFDPAAVTGYKKISCDPALLAKFDLGNSYDFSGMLEQQLRGEIDSWAIRWYQSVFLRSGITLFPRKTLVENTGFDGSGTHCARLENSAPISLPVFQVSTYPAAMISETAKEAVYGYLKKRWGMRNRVKKWLRVRAKSIFTK